MGKKRIIDSKIRESQTFAQLTYRQRDLWVGLIACADDQGRLPGVPAFVRSTVWPYDDIKLAEVEADIQALEALGNIIWYENDERQYIQIVNWWRYQSPQWASPSDHPAPDGWVDRYRYHAKGGGIETMNWDTPGGYCILPSEVPSGQGRATENVNDDDDINDDVKDDDTGDAPPFRALLDEFLSASGIPETMLRMDKAVPVVNNWVKAGVKTYHVRQAIEEMRGKSLDIVGPWSVTNGINIVMGRENGKKSSVPSAEEIDTWLQS